MKKIVLALGGVLMAAALAASSLVHAQVATEADARAVPSVRPGINDNFKDADLDADAWLDRFELESREVYAARQEVLKACQVRPGDRVADIGFGTGFYTLMFAEAVEPGGWVVGVEIAPRFLEYLNQRASERGLTNLTPVLGSDRSINLPPNSLQLAFVCDTYHHFEYPQPILASIHRSLREGGTLVVVDFERIEGRSRAWVLDHVRAGKGEVRREIEAAGFEFVEEVTIPGFQENYLLRFRKKMQSP